VWQELGGLNPSNRVLDQATELLALRVGNGGLQVLNLDQSFADEYDLGDFDDAGHPGVANQLGIQSQQALGLIGVSARTGFPLEQAVRPVEFADSVNVRHEVVFSCKWPGEFDLQITPRLEDLDSIVLAEPVQ
jgi:hypothetical protein